MKVISLTHILCVFVFVSYVYGEDHECDSKISSLPDPQSKCCGIEADWNSKIVGGKTTSLKGHPWAVLLEFENQKGETKTPCSGALISNQYVVTAGYCANAIVSGLTLKSVRVGEFDKEHSGRDCIDTADGSTECNDEAMSIPVEKVKYPIDLNAKTRNDNIALIKLRDPVKYTDFVRPICLPSSEPSNADVEIVGWGGAARRMQEANHRTKQAERVNVVNLEECKKKYEKRHKAVTDEHICTVDSCSGDGGGPVTGVKDGQYELVAVVGFGPVACNTPDMPAVQTKIYNNIEWIKANMN